MPISPLPWKAVQAANIESECWVIEDANGKAVAVAQDVMLDMHLGWTKMSRENVEFIVESVNSHLSMLEACKRALEQVSGTDSSTMTSKDVLHILRSVLQAVAPQQET